MSAERTAPVAAELSEADDAAEAAYQTGVRANLRRNYLAHLCHGLLGQTGFRLLNAPTFIPAYLYLLTGTEMAVGIARSLQSFGMFLSPILGATTIEHRKRVLPFGLAVGASMRLAVLGIALACFFLSDEWAVRAIWALLLCFGFLMGMQGVIFSFLMSKVIPVERRGVLLGLRNFLAGLTASGVAYLGGKYLVEPNVWGNGYATTFLLAFVLTSLGLAMLLFVREPEPPRLRAATSVRERLSELPALLRSDPGYTRYFLARALATMGRMAVPFYFLYAGNVIGITGASLAILTPCFLLSNSGTNLIWGWIADRTGFRVVFLAALGVWILSAVTLMASTDMLGFATAFVGLGAGIGGFMMSAQNIVLEFGTREDLPIRIAVANSAAELVGSVGPILGAGISMLWSYEALFWVAIAFKLASIAVVFLYVEEPRRRRTRLLEPS